MLIVALLLGLLTMQVACSESAPSEDTQSEAERRLEAGSGSFLFTASPGARDRPVRVWYHIPENLDRDARVVFTMHGSGGTSRGGRSNRDAWAPLADRYGFVVFAPEFSWAYYPTASHYHWGNMHTEEGQPIDESQWAFTTVSGMFDDVQRRFGITTPNYSIYGHSAGAQFVQRMMMFRPDPRIEVYIAANPGNYTMPSMEWEYPYGMDKGNAELNRQTEALLTAALQRPFVLLLGSADTSTELSANNMRPEAMAQGRNRAERADRFFELAREEAEKRNVSFNWVFRVIPDIAHSNTGMAESAVRTLTW
jgi:hypothetical protein